MFRVVTERIERFVDPFCRDLRLPEKGLQTGGGRNAKLAIAAVGANMTSYALPVRRIQMRPVRHGTGPPGILLREQMVVCQRESRWRRARAARTTRAKTTPTTTGVRRAGRA
jgi:hypothetical protein